MEWLSYRWFCLSMLCTPKDDIIQEGTENRSPNVLLETLFHASLLQSPASNHYCVWRDTPLCMVEILAPKVFCPSCIRQLHFSGFSSAAMPFVFSSVTAWAALAFQSLTIHSVLLCCGGQGVQQFLILSL